LKAAIFKHSLFTFIAIVLAWWIPYLSVFNIPEHVPGTNLNITGLFLIALFIGVFISLHSSILKRDKSISIWKLTLAGIITSLVAESLFQIIRVSMLTGISLAERVKYFLIASIGVSLLAAVISFFVAFQLKTKRTNILIIFITAFIIVFNLLLWGVRHLITCLLFTCLAVPACESPDSNDRKDAVTDNSRNDIMDKFDAFIKKEKFVENSAIFYPGISDPELRPMLTEKINQAAEDFRAVSLSSNPQKEHYLEKMRIGLKRFNDTNVRFDTEDRERVCHYFEELMQIVGLESSEGMLNRFMYGFDLTK